MRLGTHSVAPGVPPASPRHQGGFGTPDRAGWGMSRLTVSPPAAFPTHVIFSKKQPYKVTERTPRPQSPMETVKSLFLPCPPPGGSTPSPARGAGGRMLGKMLPLCSEVWERGFLGLEQPGPIYQHPSKTGLQARHR